MYIFEEQGNKYTMKAISIPNKIFIKLKIQFLPPRDFYDQQ